MIELEDGYLILGISLCDENAPFARCLDLVRLNRDGKVVWKRIYDGWPDSNLNTSGRTLAVYQNTIYLATEIWKTDHNELRMMAFDMEGHLLYEKDFYFPYSTVFFLKGMIASNERLLVYGGIKSNNQHHAFIKEFDIQFNLLGEYNFGSNDFIKRGVDLKETSDGHFLLVYGEEVVTLLLKMVLKRLDSQLKVVVSNEIRQTEPGNPFREVDIMESGSQKYILSWYNDLYPLYDTFPYPAAVYGLDAQFNVEWEHIFVHRSAKEAISIAKTKNGNLLGIGASDYFGILDLYPGRWGDGWCFLYIPVNLCHGFRSKLCHGCEESIIYSQS